MLIGLPIIFIIVAFVCTPLVTCFKCCCCCCKADNKEKYLKKRDPFKCLVTTCIYIVSIVLFIGCLYWATQLHRTIESAQPLMCTGVTIVHEVQHGYKDDKITFAGIGGVSFFLNTLKTETEKLKSSPSLQNLVGKKFKENSDKFGKAISDFYTRF